MPAANKRELRVHLLGVRAGIPPRERARQSGEIAARVTSWPAWRRAETILLYRSIRDEVATDALFARALDDGKRVGSPRTLPLSIEPVPVDGKTAWLPGPFGVMEPREPAGPPPALWDLVVVPGVAFDRVGHRLGYGKGYYDVFLKSGMHNLSVGLCFSQLLQERLPSEAHDVAVNGVVTPTGAHGQRVDMFD